MRILVCGGRDYDDWKAVYAALDRLHAERGITLIIHGACQQKGMLAGADRWAEKWAQDREVPYVGVPARWAEGGNKAGPERNARMLNEWRPDGVMAFPGGRGTNDMKVKAKAAGMTPWEPVKAGEGR